MTRSLLMIICVASAPMLCAQTPDPVSEMAALYAAHCSENDKTFDYSAAQKQLTLSGHVVPTNGQTLVRAERSRDAKGLYNVVFMCQNATYTYHVMHPEERRAELVLSMQNKKAAKTFVKLFRELSAA